MSLDPSFIINSVTASQESLGSGATLTCDLGSLANGASATVTVSSPSTSGTLAATADAGSSSGSGVSSPVVEVMLLRGPFVTPQELQTSTAASLTSSSAATISHGSGNTMLTLSGANLLPGLAVTWNGSYRTTTIVDATHVTVAIPASDLASAASATVVATNPGAPASNSLTVTIN